jgi:hypothetical protein
MRDNSTILQALLERLNQGDLAARRELLQRAFARPRRLANTMPQAEIARMLDLHARKVASFGSLGPNDSPTSRRG